jgi:hypothetical protein
MILGGNFNPSSMNFTWGERRRTTSIWTPVFKSDDNLDESKAYCCPSDSSVPAAAGPGMLFLRKISTPGWPWSSPAEPPWAGSCGSSQGARRGGNSPGPCVGNSMGSLVGGLYAAGYSPSDLEELAARINWNWLLNQSDSYGGSRLIDTDNQILTLEFDNTAFPTQAALSMTVKYTPCSRG